MIFVKSAFVRVRQKERNVLMKNHERHLLFTEGKRACWTDIIINDHGLFKNFRILSLDQSESVIDNVRLSISFHDRNMRTIYIMIKTFLCYDNRKDFSLNSHL